MANLSICNENICIAYTMIAYLLNRAFRDVPSRAVVIGGEQRILEDPAALEVQVEFDAVGDAEEETPDGRQLRR